MRINGNKKEVPIKAFQVGLTGAAGSGKTTIAKALSQTSGVALTSFASPLKEMALVGHE